MKYNFSDAARKQEPNAIREIFKTLSNKDVISFAGGFPSKDNIPNKEIAEISSSLLLKDGKDLMQYGATEGYPKLKTSLLKFIERFNIYNQKENNILITSGAQQSIDLISRIMINKNDVILVQETTYLAAILIFKSYGAKVIGVKFNDQNVDLIDLEKKLKKYMPKFFYLVPTFSNPTGKEIDEKNRKDILNLINKYKTLLVEDDPYSELRYFGKKISSIKSFDKNERVIYISSFSKTICPGLRVAYSVANKEIIRKMTIMKQSNDVYSPYLNQAIANEYITTNKYENRLDKLKEEYKEKMEFMKYCIDKYMPKTFIYNNTNGGLFIYGYFKDDLDTDKLFDLCLKNNVVFVTGKPFSIYNNKNSIRLNFSNSTIEKIEEGIKRIAKCVLMLKEN